MNSNEFNEVIPNPSDEENELMTFNLIYFHLQYLIFYNLLLLLIKYILHSMVFQNQDLIQITCKAFEYDDEFENQLT